MMRRMWLAAALSAALMVVAPACGDDFGLGQFAKLEVNVDSTSYKEDGTVYFVQAIQQSITKEVEIINPGNKTLVLEGIDWERDDDGQPIKNKYVEIDWRGAVGANSFPYEIEPDVFAGLSFAVKFSPPLGLALDDFSDSVLLIRSNAHADDGDSKIPELRITFAMRQDAPFPRVTPTNYSFANASVAKPERQDFRIYNDPQLATASFNVTSISFETVTNEFKLVNNPSLPATVLEPGNAGYKDVTFTVEYAPTDDTPDTNALLITTDATAGGTLRVPLSTNRTSGSYALSYSDTENRFDFTNTSQVDTRSVIITSEGPGPITIKAPHIEPTEARDDYTVKAFIPATEIGGADTEVTSWPRGLQVGRALRLDVTFQAGAGETANGELVIPYDSPDFGEIKLPLLSGSPKSKMVLGPKTGSIFVTGDATGGETGKRKVVIYNEGNGELDLIDIKVRTTFDVPPDVYSMATFTSQGVQPDDLLIIEVDYDLGGIPGGKESVSESLEITYYNDFTEQNVVENFGLIAGDIGDKAAPTADAGEASDYAGAVAGTPLTLDGSGSTGGSGTLDANGYIWYLTAKPAGSRARLNEQSSATVTFTPDMAGSYTAEMFVFAASGDSYLYSDPASVTFTVGAN